MFCPKCGKEVPQGAAFCGSCGSPIGGQGGAQTTAPTADASVRSATFRPASPTPHAADAGYAAAAKKKLPIVPIAIAVVAVIAVIAVAALVFGGKSGEVYRYIAGVGGSEGVIVDGKGETVDLKGYVPVAAPVDGVVPALCPGSSADDDVPQIAFVDMQGNVKCQLADLAAESQAVDYYPWQTIDIWNETPAGVISVAGYDAQDNMVACFYNTDGELIYNLEDLRGSIAQAQNVPGFEDGSGNAMFGDGSSVWGGVPVDPQGNVLIDAVRAAAGEGLSIEACLNGLVLAVDPDDDNALVAFKSDGTKVSDSRGLIGQDGGEYRMVDISAIDPLAVMQSSSGAGVYNWETGKWVYEPVADSSFALARGGFMVREGDSTLFYNAAGEQLKKMEGETFYSNPTVYFTTGTLDDSRYTWTPASGYGDYTFLYGGAGTEDDPLMMYLYDFHQGGDPKELAAKKIA